MRKSSLLLATVLLGGCAATVSAPLEKSDVGQAPPSTSNYTGTTASWMAAGEAAIQQRLAARPNTRRAKNIILFVGDGMGVSTLTAGRILEGQLAGRSGEEGLLSFESFPYTALVKTYNVNAQVADSAGTATALNTGTKTEIGVINTAPTHKQGVCDNYLDDAPTPLAFFAEQIGMSTGVVTTARLTHATPAAVYARSPHRNWEAPYVMPPEAVAAGCPGIAEQILEDMTGDGLEVALGGGSSMMLPEGTGSGARKDGRNIATEWLNSKKDAAYVTNKAELANIDTQKTNRLLGLFSASHMDFTAQKNAEQPDLADMTEAAIEVLSKNDKGYYLMVEAGRIDHGHHAGNANAALNDTVALSKAVRRALEMVDTRDTLILVTADHSHTFTIAGYPRRGNPILGLVSPPWLPEGEFLLAEDGKPYTTVGYQNGQGYVEGERPTLTQEQALSPTFLQQAAYPLRSETHAGEDVALFAVGPWAHLVSGTIEQNVVFHIMDHALSLRKRAAKKSKRSQK